MNWIFPIVWLVIFVAVLIPGNATAQDVPKRYFADAPVDAREFMTKAKQAEAIVDPLQRCLSYPDLPANQWQVSLARAECEYSFAHAISLKTIKQYVEADQLAELDALFRTDLERHFVKEGFSEVIHRDFAAIDDSYDSGRLTQRWLEKAPKSPFALTARALFYRHMAGKARGSKWASDTPAENMKRMAEFVLLSVDLYNDAIRIEPRMLDAYVGLMIMARIDSRGELEDFAFTQANAIDPACRSVSWSRMISLKPRWGGSYEQMEQYAEALKAYLPLRPLLADSIGEVAADKANVASRNKNYGEAERALASTVRTVTLSEFHDDYASYLGSLKASPWPQILHLVSAERFSELSPHGARQLGRLLTESNLDLEWAIKLLKRAVLVEPESTFGQFWLAQALLRADRKVELLEPLTVLTDDETYRKDALYQLSVVFDQLHRPKDALENLDLLLKEVPEYIEGVARRGQLLMQLGRKAEAHVEFTRYLELSRNDPEQAETRAEVQHMLNVSTP